CNLGDIDCLLNNPELVSRFTRMPCTWLNCQFQLNRLLSLSTSLVSLKLHGWNSTFSLDYLTARLVSLTRLVHVEIVLTNCFTIEESNNSNCSATTQNILRLLR